jgi:hypothetical protein
VLGSTTSGTNSPFCCSATTVACVLVLPQFRFLYGTGADWVLSIILIALPFVGAFGAIRYVPWALWIRALLAIGYVLAMVVPVLMTAIFVGCSWAGACF